MRILILISLLILTGGFSTTQKSLIERYNIFGADVQVVEEMPKLCADLEGCVLVYVNKKEVYISKDAKDFEDVLAHELLHYYLPTFSEEKIKILTPKFKDYINKRYVR